jgi:predicted dehydrogenase
MKLIIQQVIWRIRFGLLLNNTDYLRLINMIKVGIAGFGVVGQKRAECIKNNPNMSLVAVCDRDASLVDKCDDGTKFYGSFEDLLLEKLDALFVCMTNDIACEVTIRGLENGINVFCEKPPGRDFDEVEKVINFYKTKKDLTLMYGFNHRYHDSVLEALKIFQSGILGSIISMRGIYGKAKLITFNQPDWRTKRAISGGGVLLDQGIHMLDLMRLFGGDFNEIHSFISNNHWKYDVEDNAYALMRTKNGVIAMLNSSATQWRHQFRLDINLEKGNLILGGIITGTKSYGAETLTVVHADPDNDRGDPLEVVTRYNKDLSWQREVDQFAGAILGVAPLVCGTPEDALETMRLIQKIYFNDKRWRDCYGIKYIQ